MGKWNSDDLHLTSQILGWISFTAWSTSFYPQVILNYRRKSVVGLNFDYLLLNLTKHYAYLFYNVVLYFSSVVQKQYRNKYGSDQMVPVELNDVAFSIHAVVLTAFTLFQTFIYERNNQKFSKAGVLICGAAMVSALICTIVAAKGQSWLWLISLFNIVQVAMTVIKYIPQAYMNFKRKSTDGFSIGNILLDLLGGFMNNGQMIVQSIDQGSWVNFYGNIGKTLLSLVSTFFDFVFIVQHYLLYHPAKPENEERLPSQAPDQHHVNTT